MPLPLKHARFAAEFVKDLNATQAAVRAGYSAKTARVQGSRLLTNADIQEEIRRLNSQALERNGVEAAEIIRELKRIGFADPSQAFDEEGRRLPLHKMPPEIRACISGVDVEELTESDGEGGRIPIGELVKIRFWDKPKCLELLGKHKVLFTDKVEHGLSKTLEDLVRESNAPEAKDE